MEVASPYFDGKNTWALILGGSSGMGFSAAKKMILEGMNVYVVHRTRKKDLDGINHLRDLAERHAVKFLEDNSDATRAETREKFLVEFEPFGNAGHRVALLLHSIAKGNLGELKDLHKQSIELTIRAMGTSLWDWGTFLIDVQLFNEHPRVIGLTSEGSQRAIKGYAAVSMAKAGLEALIRSMALEWGEYGVRANLIQPGVTDTPSFRMIPNSNFLKKVALQRNPMNRLTTPEDVADVIYLLCRKESRWINGAIIRVDGGEGIV